jgi:hypothetical protein
MPMRAGATLAAFLRHRKVLAICGVTAAVFITALPAQSPAAGYWGPGYTICKSIRDHGGERIYVSAKHVRCRKAVQIIHEYYLAPEDEKELVGPDSYNGYVRLKRFPGWKCTSGASAGGCRKGGKMAAYNFFYPRVGAENRR